MATEHGSKMIVGLDIGTSKVVALVGELNLDGELEIVLQDFEQPPLPIHVVYQSGRKVPAKVRTFVDFCSAQLSQSSALNPAGRN